jgi:hypothetical protein
MPENQPQAVQDRAGKLVLAGALLALAIFAASLALWPDWRLELRALAALGGGAALAAAGWLAGRRREQEKLPGPTRSIDTGGGLYIEGDVNTGGGDFVAGNKITQHILPEPSSPALRQIPAPPDDFTGRAAELEAVLAGIAAGGAHISGLQGAGGVG